MACMIMAHSANPTARTPLPLVRPAVRDLSALLNTTWRVTLQDDRRTFTGRFLVVDKRVRHMHVIDQLKGL